MNGMNFSKLYNNDLYLEDVRYVADLDLPWEKLQDKSILLSGATGLVGSFLVDVLMRRNEEGLNCTVYPISCARLQNSTAPSISCLAKDILSHLKLLPSYNRFHRLNVEL